MKFAAFTADHRDEARMEAVFQVPRRDLRNLLEGGPWLNAGPFIGGGGALNIDGDEGGAPRGRTPG